MKTDKKTMVKNEQGGEIEVPKYLADRDKSAICMGMRGNSVMFVCFVLLTVLEERENVKHACNIE